MDIFQNNFDEGFFYIFFVIFDKVKFDVLPLPLETYLMLIRIIGSLFFFFRQFDLMTDFLFFFAFLRFFKELARNKHPRFKFPYYSKRPRFKLQIQDTVNINKLFKGNITFVK